MLHTPVCDLLGIQHPLMQGGMSGSTSVALVVAASQAGALGTLGAARYPAEQIAKDVAAVRAGTDKPFAVNFLLFMAREEAYAAALAEKPPVISLAWAREEQKLASYVGRAHEAGCKVIYMASSAPEALRAKQAGADVVAAQGMEGGGHMGWMATMALLPMVVDAVAPTPVLAAGGIADGRGVAAALALGAQGVLIGTRFLATTESPLHPNFKQAIVDSDGHDTVVTDLVDIARGSVWPGAMARALRNDFIARWAGREWDLRAHQAAAAAALTRAIGAGDVREAALLIGQDAGLIHDLPTSAELVARIVAEAEAVLTERLPALVR